MVKVVRSARKLSDILLDHMCMQRPNEDDFGVLQKTAEHGSRDAYEEAYDYTTDSVGDLEKEKWTKKDQEKFVEMVGVSLEWRDLRDIFYFIQDYTALQGMFDIEIQTRIRTTKRARDELGIVSDVVIKDRFL